MVKGLNGVLSRRHRPKPDYSLLSDGFLHDAASGQAVNLNDVVLGGGGECLAPRESLSHKTVGINAVFAVQIVHGTKKEQFFAKVKLV